MRFELVEDVSSADVDGAASREAVLVGTSDGGAGAGVERVARKALRREVLCKVTGISTRILEKVSLWSIRL